MKAKILALFLILFIGISSFSVVLAKDRNRNDLVTENEGTESANESPEPSRPPKPSGFDFRGGRIKACQAKENSIKERTTSLMNLVSNIEGKFDAITSRVQDFYTNKVVPSGKSVSDYDSLVADIGTKKVAVTTALTTAQADLTGFSCTTDNPKGLLDKFRMDMQTVKKALQDYRTAIKNLIVAVHTAFGGESESPIPSASPVATSTPVPTATP